MNYQTIKGDDWLKEHQRPVDGKGEAVTLEDFVAHMPSHSYIYIPTRETWPGSSVDSRTPPVPGVDDKPVKASRWLDANAAVEQMTWAPGLPEIINDRLIAHGGWIERPGVRCFKLYRPPILMPKAGPVDLWLEHLHHLFGEDGHHIERWLAQRVQCPDIKINHALVLGGAQGIGKDTLLEPVKHAIGPWNFAEVSPKHMLGRFNDFLKSVILRVSEGRDLGEIDRYQFYDHLKSYTAAPPDVLRVDEKNLREYTVPNCTGTIITTNHKTDGIYLPADDRRHFVAWSGLAKDHFDQGYWNRLWGWYASGGIEHVAAYLATLDLSGFDPKAPPPKTLAFWEIVDASRAPEDAELADAIDLLGASAALTLAQIVARADGSFGEWLRDRRNNKRIPHRLEAIGYVAVRNNDAADGLWRVSTRRQVIYARAELAIRDRIAAAQEVAGSR